MQKKEPKSKQLSREIAWVLLEYIAMEDCKAKENMTVLCGDEINRYLRLVNNYAKELGLTQEETLKKIIEGGG